MGGAVLHSTEGMGSVPETSVLSVPEVGASDDREVTSSDAVDKIENFCKGPVTTGRHVNHQVFLVPVPRIIRKRDTDRDTIRHP